MTLNATHTAAHAYLHEKTYSPVLKAISNLENSNLHVTHQLGKIIPFERKPTYNELTLQKAEECILANISNPDYKITQLARDTAYSQRQLTRIIKKMTGMSPVHFVLEIRLKKAYELLIRRELPTIALIREEVGIIHPSYFTRKFVKRFGIRPKALMA